MMRLFGKHLSWRIQTSGVITTSTTNKWLKHGESVPTTECHWVHGLPGSAWHTNLLFNRLVNTLSDLLLGDCICSRY